MPVFASPGAFVSGRTVPAILSQVVNQGAALMYQTSAGAFINVPPLGNGPNGGGLINAQNTGSGNQLSSVSGNLLSLKSLAAGTNVTFTDNGQTITINSTGGGGSPNTVSVFYDELDYTSGTTFLVSLPAGTIILSTEVLVMTAFNGTPTLTLGTSGDPTMLIDESEIDLTEANNTLKNDISFVVPGVGNQDIQSFFTANGATQGQFSLFIEYALI